jgi:hypothetical protein
MSTANIFTSIIFGSIGFAAFIYRKKQMNFKALVIVLALIHSTDGKYSTGFQMRFNESQAVWF